MKPHFKIDSLRQMAVFAQVVSAGSMVAAAERLKMSPSAVSQHIRALERETGIRLLARTTRRLQPTEDGLRFFEHCRAMLDNAEAAMSGVDAARDTPRGDLRVTAPLGFGKPIAAALAPLLRTYPDLRLTLSLTDDTVALNAERCDIAIRVGHLADTDWVAKRLGGLPVHLVAAASYLERIEWRPDLERLKALDWLVLEAHHTRGAALDVIDPCGAPHRIRLDRNAVRGIGSTQDALQALCEAGAGVAVLAGRDIAFAMGDDRLRPVLPGWTIPDLRISALTPDRASRLAKVRFGLDALLRHFAM